MSHPLEALVAGVTREYTPPATLADASPAQRRHYEHVAARRGLTPEQILGEYRAAHAHQLAELSAHDAADAITATVRRS
ncbi:hypothetical protein [Rathayibacter sp. AY1E6]|uniref:hypothetical protein n=1 Tax=Rathayibacter sp. AY1E6 TaxID=2080554 RepID=UPI000CE765B5|nr:hypothetical protein [Rathayibacter sp. AY1E6]PPF72092.1 hypothetical protein C5C46_07395 [Rathayibacter sp. AY1E6]